MAPVSHCYGNQLPLVLHIIHRLAIGGLENGLANLVNHMPPHRYRHAIVILTDCTDFRRRIHRVDIPIIALHKRRGHDFSVHLRLWRILRSLRPDLVHTRNLGALEYLIPAVLAGVPGRVHGEHGRDIYDLHGSKFKYKLLHRAIRPLVDCYTAVSADLAGWLVHTVGADEGRVRQIYNGVDLQRFFPRDGCRTPLGPENFAPKGTLVVGTVGRMEAVKDQLTLVRAFLHLLDIEPGGRERLRLVMIGEGPLREESRQLLRAANAQDLAWLPGERMDIAEALRGLDLFVLPSLAEGASNTILEAMASGLPVVATRVGGNPELVDDGHTGVLVPPADPLAMSEAIRSYLHDNRRLDRHGQAGRKKVEAHFSIEVMIGGYMAVYDAVLHGKMQRRNPKPERFNASSPG